MKHQKLIFALLSFTGLGLIFLYMAGVFEPKVSGFVKEEKIPEKVQTQVLTKVSRPVIHQYAGSVIASQQATLTARITAQISQILTGVGQKVRAGDLLMRLDNQDLSAKVRQSEQAIVAAQAQVNFARKENARIQTLFKKHLVAKRDSENAQTALKSAQAELKRLQASLGQAQATLGYSLILAPFDAVVTSKYVNPGDTASPSQPLLTLYNPQSLEFEVAVSASDRQKLTLGQTIPLVIEGAGRKINGKITEISPGINKGTQTLTVKLSLPENSDLYPGTFGRLSLTAGEQEVLEISTRDMTRVGQLEYVQVVRNNQLERRLIQTQASEDPDKRIVTKGLKEGDAVVHRFIEKQ